MNNSHIAVKRILRDYSLTKSLEENENIYTHLNDENIFNIYSLHIGDDNTPYAGGFYFFHWKFDLQYPFKPPICTFQTQGNGVRFHPNFYNESFKGKVCLSVLNTWDMPTWTSVNTLGSILIIIKSIMTENPIQYEPGYETSHNKDYDIVIGYYNNLIGIIKMLTNTPEDFKAFLPVMENYFLNNFIKYYENAFSGLKHEGCKYQTHYSIYAYINYRAILFKLITIYYNLGEKHNFNCDNSYKIYIERHINNKRNKQYYQFKSSLGEEPEINFVKKTIKKIYPNIKASNFDNGYNYDYQNKTFVVYSDKRGYKRWKASDA